LEYTQLFAPSIAGDGRLDLDLIAIDPADAASAELLLQRVIVDSLPLTALTSPGTLVWENVPGDSAPWTASTLDDFYHPAVLTTSVNGLTASGKAIESPDPTQATVGIFTSPLGLTLVEGAVYRFDFDLVGGAPAGEASKYPSIRLRINDETYMSSAMIVVDGMATSNPLPTVGEMRTYSLFYEAPAGFAGRRVSVSFDYIWTPGDGRDASLPLTLQRVGARQYDRPW
jgi:hypothetical protein